MVHRIWKETKQKPVTAGLGNMLGCCLVSFHFRLAILSTSTVWPDASLSPMLFTVVCWGRLFAGQPGCLVELTEIHIYWPTKLAYMSGRQQPLLLSYCKLAGLTKNFWQWCYYKEHCLSRCREFNFKMDKSAKAPSRSSRDVILWQRHAHVGHACLVLVMMIKQTAY